MEGMEGGVGKSKLDEFQKILSSVPTAVLQISQFVSSSSSTSSSPCSSVLEGPLGDLAMIARSDEGRRELADFETVPLLLSLLPSFLPHALSATEIELSVVEKPSVAARDSVHLLAILLRALRNLCAGEPLNQNAFRVCKGVESLASLSRDFLLKYEYVHETNHAASRSLGGLFKVLLQLLGNVVGFGDANKSAVWENFFPDLFLKFCTWKDVQEPLCMVLFTCCHLRDDHSEQISEHKGAILLASLILDDKRVNSCQLGCSSVGSGQLSKTPNSEVSSNDWLSFLVWELCVEKPYFPAIFGRLCQSSCFNFSSGDSFSDSRAGYRIQLEQQTFNAAKANLLRLLCSILYEDIVDEGNLSMAISTTTVIFLVEIIGHLAHCASSLSGEACELPTGSPVIDILGYSLLMARKLCAMESKLNFRMEKNVEPDPSGACDFLSSGKVKTNNHIGSLDISNNNKPICSSRRVPYEIREVFTRMGLVPLLLRMLQALGPPATVQKVINLQNAGEGQAASHFLQNGNVDTEIIFDSASSVKLARVVDLEGKVGADKEVFVDKGDGPKEEPSNQLETTYTSEKEDNVESHLSCKDNIILSSHLQKYNNVLKESYLAKDDGPLPCKNLYKGFRRDIVSVLANISFKNFDVQEQIREGEGLCLLLQQCIADKDNPFLREWGFWALRNLLYDNEKNQQEVSGLHVKGLASSSEILETGLTVEIDPTTERPKLVNISSMS